MKADDEEVVLGYASNRNISFRGQVYTGYTWGEWRRMTDQEKEDAYTEELGNLVELWEIED